MGSNTLYDSEGSDSNEPTPQQSTLPTKMVMFNLPKEESRNPMEEFTKDTNERLERSGCQVQNAALQNDEADAHLVHTAWLRKTSDNVYMSNRKAMNLQTYIHAVH